MIFFTGETKDQSVLRQLQQLVDDATDLCNVPLVLLSLLDRETGYFHFRAMGGMNKPLLRSAIKAGELVAGRDLFSFKHKPDINKYIRTIVEGRVLSISDIDSAIENILPKPAFQAVQFFLKLKQIASMPLIINGQVEGIAVFISQKEKIAPADLKLMNTFANESRLLLENLLLASTLEQQVTKRTGELQTALNAHERIEGELKESEQRLLFLSRTAEQLMDLPTEADLFAFIANNLRQFIRDSIIGTAEYDEASGCLFARSIVGLGKSLQPAIDLFGRDPYKMPFQGKEEILEILKAGKLTEITGGIEELSVDIPPPVWLSIKKLLNIGALYVIGITWQGKLLGDVAILLPNGATLKNGPAIEAFVKGAAVILQRRNAETALLASREAFYNIVEKSPIGLLVLDQEKKVCFINAQGEKLLGRQREDFLGQLFVPPLADKHLPEIAIKLANGRTGTGVLNIVETSWAGKKAELITVIDVTSRAQAETELNKKVKELEDFCKAIEGREIRMAELEKEIERFRKQAK
ncbi:MAG: GAF domain-containing protein [Candidatus Margulisiibacteriota bacterium]